MYHEPKLFSPGYYDSIDELPTKAKITFPDGTKKEMTVNEMLELSEDGWLTVMHSVNYGVCDHWTSVPLKTWVRERFERIIRYTTQNGKTIGYNRSSCGTTLTKEKVWKSEVWNS